MGQNGHSKLGMLNLDGKSTVIWLIAVTIDNFGAPLRLMRIAQPVIYSNLDPLALLKLKHARRK